MKVAFLGDSITEGAGASKEKYLYIHQVCKLLNAEVLNYGAGGTRIAKQTKPSEETRCDRDFYPVRNRNDEFYFAIA